MCYHQWWAKTCLIVTCQSNQVIFKLWRCTNITKNSAPMMSIFNMVDNLPFNSIQHIYMLSEHSSCHHGIRVQWDRPRPNKHVNKPVLWVREQGRLSELDPDAFPEYLVMGRCASEKEGSTRPAGLWLPVERMALLFSEKRKLEENRFREWDKSRVPF